MLNIIFLLVSAACAVWTYIEVKPDSTPKAGQDITAFVSPEYQVTTRVPLTVWPSGTVLEQGMIAYFYAAQPEIRVNPKVEITGLTDGSISGTITTRAYVCAVNDKSEVYWSYPFRNQQEQNFTLSTGESSSKDQTVYTAETLTLDPVAANDLISLIGKELMFQAGIFQMVVTSDIRLFGTVNDSSINKNIIITLPFTLQTVSFSAPKAADQAASLSLISTAPAPAMMQSIKAEVLRHPYPFLADALLLIVLLFFILRRSGKVKEEMEYHRFKEWITEGSVEIKNKYTINIYSLEGLVDLAIDLDKRVIHDSKVGKYYVLEENLVYSYDPDYMKSILENKQQLGKLLLERGLLRPEELETGLYYQQRIGSKLGESLIALGFINETTLYSTLAAQQKLDYYELDLQQITDTGWLDKLGIGKARAFQALPLGRRTDGKLTVACGDTVKKGIKEALQEMLQSDIYLVAAKPSAIYEALERLEAKEKEKSSYSAAAAGNKTTPYERLSEKEREEFLNSYYRGFIIPNLFLKASGLVDPVLLAQAPNQENIISWLVGHNIISGDTINLLKGLDRITEEMEWKARQEKQLPELLVLLEKSNYLTENTVKWVNQELQLEKSSEEAILKDNYLVSEGTIRMARLFIDIIDSILNKSV